MMYRYGVLDADTMSQYVAALYWSLMTVTTIGYGDVSPQTDGERVFALCFMMLGAVLYAYIVGSFCQVITSLDPAASDFRSSMDHLNSLMKSSHCPQEMKVKLRTFFVHCQDVHTRVYVYVYIYITIISDHFTYKSIDSSYIYICTNPNNPF